MTDAGIVALLAVTALAVLLIEGVVLWARRSRGLAVGQWLPFVLAGAGLLVALLASALGLQWQIVAIALAVAGLAHAADLIGRRPRG
jgi:hypothetical protein